MTITRVPIPIELLTQLRALSQPPAFESPTCLLMLEADFGKGKFRSQLRVVGYGETCDTSRGHAHQTAYVDLVSLGQWAAVDGEGSAE